MAERVRVRDLSSQEGSRLLRTVRRDAGSAVTACRTNYGLMDSTEDVEPCCPSGDHPSVPAPVRSVEPSDRALQRRPIPPKRPARVSHQSQGPLEPDSRSLTTRLAKYRG
jgi:hypothetical protein